MEQNEAIEMELWEYLDGTCNEADRQRIAALVANDPIWMKKLAALNALQAEITAALETEQPSMRFTKNVMEAVSHVQIAPATKKYINMAVIKAIAAVFILILAATLVYGFATADWHTTTTVSKPPFNLNRLDLSGIFNSHTFQLLMPINIILGLLLIDTLLRRRREGMV